MSVEAGLPIVRVTQCRVGGHSFIWKGSDMSGLEQTIWIKAWQKCGICAGSGKLPVLRRGKPERADCACCEGKGVVDRYMSREEVRVWLGLDAPKKESTA